MKKNYLLLFFLSFVTICGYSQSDKIYIDATKKGHDIQESMYGLFFEEINHSGDGGLYAELIQNRGFEEHVYPSGMTYRDGKCYAPYSQNYYGMDYVESWVNWDIEAKKYLAWSVEGDKCTTAKDVITPTSPLHENTPNAFQLTISDMQSGGKAALINSGYWGIAVKTGAKYDLRFYLRTNDYDGTVTAKIFDKSSNAVIASKEFTVTKNDTWVEYTTELTAGKTTNNAEFRLEFSSNGTILADYVSLFPQHTYKGRKNGLRRDIAEFLEDLNPTFMRWPGGCIVEGITLENRVKWQETIGDPMTRRGEYVLWDYRSTFGFGYHEFLQYCEDVGMDGMFVANIGLSCALRNGDYIQGAEALEEYLQDIRDAIEYALGDVSTEWGAKRAENGHPEPFPLKYVELGNENGTPRYIANFNYLYGILKAEYPDLIFINTLTWWDGDLALVEKTDMIDPHWYETPDYFYKNVNLFDDVKRGDFTVYVGEYACNNGVGKGNMDAALSEAVFISAMERNSDLVTMTSYAPLISNDNRPNWSCNLIWIDNEQVMGRASYYVQQMFGQNRPDYNITTHLFSDKIDLAYEGRIGLGTWNTAAEYRSVKVSKNDGSKVFYQSDFTNKPNEWIADAGEWSVADGIYKQASNSVAPAISMMDEWAFRDCTIEIEARKTSGAEGFLIVFGGDTDNAKNHYRVNIGGWGNTQTAFELVTNGGGSVVGERANFGLENNRWYTIKLVMKDAETVDCYIDGTLIVSMNFNSVKPGRLHAISGYDKEAGEVVVKVVNALEKSFDTNILLNNKNIKNTGEVITLSANSLGEENSFDDPEYISPVTSQFNEFSSDFTYSFKPYSFTILRIKADEAADGELLIPSYEYSDEPIYLHPKGTKLIELLSFAKDNYYESATSSATLKTAIGNAENLLASSDISDEAVNTQYNALKNALNTYFKAQMVSENDLTSLIENASFASASSEGWKGTAGIAFGENVAEFFWTQFGMRQTIEDLDNGYYLVSVQAFYRNGTHDFAFPAHEVGTEALNVSLFAGEKSVEVSSVYAHKFDFGWGGYCNTMWEANNAFKASEDNFANYVIVKVTDGTLTIGLRKSATEGLDWCCFDNFRLYKIPGINTSVFIPAVDVANEDDDTVYDIYGRIVGKVSDLNNLVSGIYILNGKKIFVSK